MQLTQQQHSVLAVIASWKSPFEVAKLLYPRGPSIPQRQRVAQALRDLHKHRLIELDAPQNTYQRTLAGDIHIGHAPSNS